MAGLCSSKVYYRIPLLMATSGFVFMEMLKFSSPRSSCHVYHCCIVNTKTEHWMSKTINMPGYEKNINKLLQTGTFFCVTTTAESVPRTATDVIPAWFMALKAYSANIYTQLHTVKCRIWTSITINKTEKWNYLSNFAGHLSIIRYNRSNALLTWLLVWQSSY